MEVCRARDGVQLDVWNLCPEIVGGIQAYAGDEHAGAARRDVARDLDDLLRRLARAVNDFWIALAERAVVVDRREAERLDGIERKCVERGVDVELPSATCRAGRERLTTHTSAVSSGSVGSRVRRARRRTRLARCEIVPEDAFDFAERRDRVQLLAQLRRAGKSLHVPAEVLAELDRRASPDRARTSAPSRA